MPRETFLNLSVEKKEQVDKILLAVFYDRHVSQVKVSEIVEKMQMSRGAFYKYFLDLEDAHNHIVMKYSQIIHKDILKYIMENKKDFFGGIQKFLDWCSHLNHEGHYWQGIQLLSKRSDLLACRRDDFTDASPMVEQWLDLLKLNQFNIDSHEEAYSFLYFIMALVMDSLTDFIVNQWTSEKLMLEFQYKSCWLLKGLK